MTGRERLFCFFYPVESGKIEILPFFPVSVSFGTGQKLFIPLKYGLALDLV